MLDGHTDRHRRIFYVYTWWCETENFNRLIIRILWNYSKKKKLAWLTLSFLLCSEVIQSFLIGFYQPNAMDKTLFFCRRVFQRTAWQCLCWRWRWLGCWKQNLCFCWQGTQTVFQVQAFTLLAFSLAVTKSFCPDWSHSDADLLEFENYR